MAQVRDLTPLRDADGRRPRAARGRGRARRLPRRDPQGPGAAPGEAAASTTTGSSSTSGRRASSRPRTYGGRPARRCPPRPAPGLEEVLFLGRQRDAETGGCTDVAVRISYDAASGVQLTITDPPTEPIQPLDDYRPEGAAARRRGTSYPYELTDMLAGPGGRFTEYDLDDAGALAPGRPAERATTRPAIVAGVVSTPTERYPEGITRVALLGDPTKALGALSEPECARVIAALDLAERMRVPVEWFALSAGARISMDSGTENMDWVAAALSRIVRVHAGRRRDQRRGGRDQRRRPAVLECRGHDAHAHQGHPRDDAGLGDGADRQAVPGLLRRRVGRGQLRHRRLRPGDGAQRPGPVLGARSAGRARRPAGALRPHLRRCRARTGRAGPSPPTRSTGTSPATRTRPRAATSPRSGRSSPSRPTRTARSRSTSAR